MRRYLKTYFLLSLLLLSADVASAFEPVGRAPTGQASFELVGVTVQEADTFTTFGYLTYIRDLPADAMYFDSTKQDATTARFTFVSQAKTKSKAAVDRVFNLNVEGDMQIYFRERQNPAADLKTGEGFDAGHPIARLEFRGQSVLTVISPDVGVNEASFEATQIGKPWAEFIWNQQSYALGRPEATTRLTFFGRGDRSQAEPTKARIAFGGRALATEPN